MLINKRISGIFILVVTIYCAPLFATPPQSVWSYMFEDTTKFPGIQGGIEISVNDKCANATIGRFKPRAIVNADLLSNLCSPNITTCKLVLYVGTNEEKCGGPIIGNVLMDVYQGVKSVGSDPSSPYKISYKIVSPQGQQILISAK